MDTCIYASSNQLRHREAYNVKKKRYNSLQVDQENGKFQEMEDYCQLDSQKILAMMLCRTD